MWFTKIAENPEPGLQELHGFLDGMQRLLTFILEDRNTFAFLWGDDPDLRGLAWETWQGEVGDGVKRLHESLGNERVQTRAREHGLFGRPMRFKLRALESIARKWGKRIGDQFNIRGWLRQILEAVDAILDSLIEASGVGGIVKEFKDALMALAGEA
jgi:hypothetical protein